MAWYYSTGNEQIGPVTDDVFAGLVHQGTVNAETLVWREGMSNWQAYREVAGAGVVGAESSADLVTCAQCGRSVSVDEVIELDNNLVCAACKPTVVQKLREGLGIRDATAEGIRKAHIKHEAAVKSVGSLYLLGGSFFGLGALFGMAAVFGAIPAKDEEYALGTVVVMLLFAAIFIAVGFGIRRLRPWTRVPVGILAGLGLLGFPLGTLIYAYILYLVFSERGKIVFSESYQDVITATPHIKNKTSIIVWVFLGLLVASLAMVVIGALMSMH